MPVIDPIIRPLRALVAPVPHPENSPIAIGHRGGAVILLIHPGTPATDALPAIIAEMERDYRDQLRQWVTAWGHGGVSLDAFISRPWHYAGHQAGIVVVDDLVIPPDVRTPSDIRLLS